MHTFLRPRLNSAHIGVACPLFFYTPLLIPFSHDLLKSTAGNNPTPTHAPRFHNYLQECTGLFDPSFHTLAHDIRLLLVRFAYEKSFSGESGGGGPQSNMHLLPYYLHVGAHVMNLWALTNVACMLNLLCKINLSSQKFDYSVCNAHFFSFLLSVKKIWLVWDKC